MSEMSQPPGWYPAQGDPPGTVRWWDGAKWVGGPQAQGVQQQAGYVAPGANQLATGQQLADPGMRILARVIDLVIATIISVVLTLIFGGASLFTAGLNGEGIEGIGVGLGVAFVLSLIPLLYFVAPIVLTGATVGKLILGMKYVKEDGEPMDTNTALVRSAEHIVGILHFVPLLNLLVYLAELALGLVSLVLLFTDPQRRTPLDRLAKTVVVKK